MYDLNENLGEITFKDTVIAEYNSSSSKEIPARSMARVLIDHMNRQLKSLQPAYAYNIKDVVIHVPTGNKWIILSRFREQTNDQSIAENKYSLIDSDWNEIIAEEEELTSK